MATLEQILGFRNLTGVVQAVKGGVPNPLPDSFMSVSRQVSGNKAEYYKVTGTRQVAEIVQYGSDAQRQGLRDVDLVPVTLIHAYQSQQWPLIMTLALTQLTSLAHDAKAQQTAEYWTREFKRRLSNLRIVATQMALFSGKIYVGANNQVLYSSSGAKYTIDFQVPAANQGAITLPSGGTLNGWSSASAAIINQLLDLTAHALRTTGYPLEYAFYDDVVVKWVTQNTEAQQYLKLNPSMNAQILSTGMIPAGFGGIPNWVRAGHSFFNDATGTNRKLLSTGQVVFTPTPSPDWWENIEGSYPVPTTILPQVGGDAASVLKSVAEVFGMFGYGMLNMNPPSVTQYAGDTFLPTLKVPAAIFQAIVT